VSNELKPVTMERHLQTVIVVTIVSLLGWVGVTVQQTQVAVARLSIEIEYLKAEVAKPNARFESMEKRLDAIERTLAEINAR